MRCRVLIGVVVLLACGCNQRQAAADDAGKLLAPVQTIPLPGVKGRIDHFAWDAKNQRLFVAGLGNNTVEVIDAAKDQVVERMTGLKTPQGIGVAADGSRIAVANDADGSCRIYDGTTLKQLATVDLKDDADNVRYDAAARRFWVGYGEGGLAAIDPENGKLLADVKLDAHPESFQLETKGTRIFVNVPHARHVAVIDREKEAVVAKWPLSEAAANFSMALDEANHRLFLGCRQPAKLLVLDTDSGKTITALDIVGDTDDVFYDAVRRRLYVSGGEGQVTVIEQISADRYNVAAQVQTAPGARTSFFVPDSGLLYVAVPKRGSQTAELRVFKAGQTN